MIYFISLNKLSSLIEEYQEPTGFWEGVPGLGFLLTLQKLFILPFMPTPKPLNCIIDKVPLFFPAICSIFFRKVVPPAQVLSTRSSFLLELVSHIFAFVL
jgi:hypothetical protein